MMASDTPVAHYTIHIALKLFHLCFNADAKQAGRDGHADKMLKAHSRDLVQRQQLFRAKQHQGCLPSSQQVSRHMLYPSQYAHLC